MYKCVKCHSDQVEQLAWVDLNTQEEMDGEVGEYYCRSCGSHTDVYYDRAISDEDETTKPHKNSDSYE